MKTRYHTGSGSGSGDAHWDKCSDQECWGQVLPNSQSCLLHSNADDRSRHFQLARKGRNPLLLNGVVVPKDLWIESLATLAAAEPKHLLPMISCSGAVFPFKIELNGWTFHEHVSLAGASLEAGYEIEGCRFEGGLNLSFADFDDTPMVFSGCTVIRNLSGSYGHMDRDRQHLAFMNCEIRCDARFNGFSGDLRFEECHITGSLDLSNASLSHLSLRGVRLGRQLHSRELQTRSMRAVDAVFEAATSIGPLNADSSDFTQATFESRVQVFLSGGTATFQDAVWRHGGRMEIERAQIDLTSVVLGAPVAVIGKKEAGLVSIRDADAGALSISSMDLRRCIFRGAHRLQEMTVDSTVTLPKAPGLLRSRRRCVPDEFGWRARHTKWRRTDWTIPGTTVGVAGTHSDVVLPDLSAAEIASVYRSLRKALETGADEPGASDFYYGEMEMRRLNPGASWPERLVVSAYWLVAGYGLRAMRAVVWLLGLIALATSVLSTLPPDKVRMSFGDSLLFALESAIPGMATSVGTSYWHRTVDVLLTVIGPVLLGMAALALRNRVKR